MRINYVKKIEKMKKELQEAQQSIGLPNLIFIKYIGEKKKYEIEYQYSGKSPIVMYYDELNKCIIPPEYVGTVLIDFMDEITPPGIEHGDIVAIAISDIRKDCKISLDMGISFDNMQEIKESIPPEGTVEVRTWIRKDN